jgi:N-acetylglutamate synthase
MSNQPTSTPLVRAVEERAFNAWPALQTLVMDGWLLRFADGYTKRANSINAWQPTAPLEAILDHAAPLYAARGLPIVVRLSPLASGADDAALARRGYAKLDETIVMTACLSRERRNVSPHFFIDSAPSQAWLEGFARANGVSAARRTVHDRMVGVISPPVAFARLELDETPVAWGLAACERGIAGLFDIVTATQPGGRVPAGA